MQKTVIIFECDNECGNTATPEEDLFNKSDTLPKGWIELSAVGNQGRIFDMHLCDDCHRAMTTALAARQKTT